MVKSGTATRKPKNAPRAKLSAKTRKLIMTTLLENPEYRTREGCRNLATELSVDPRTVGSICGGLTRRINNGTLADSASPATTSRRQADDVTPQTESSPEVVSTSLRHLQFSPEQLGTMTTKQLVARYNELFALANDAANMAANSYLQSTAVSAQLNMVLAQNQNLRAAVQVLAQD